MANQLKKRLLFAGGLSIWWSEMRHAILVFALVVLPLLSACGFKPIFGHHGSAKIALATLDLPNTRLGQAIGDALAGRIIPTANAPYTGSIALSETRRGRLIDAAGQARREEVTLSAELFVLTSDGKILFSRTLSVRDSFDRSGNQNTRQTNAEAVWGQLLRRLADELTLILADVPALIKEERHETESP